MPDRSLLSILVIILVAWSPLLASNTQPILKLEGEHKIKPPVVLEFCQMTEACEQPSYYVSYMAAGNRVVTYYDPEVECSNHPYPFQIETFWVTFYDICCVQWPFQVDLIVYDTTPSQDPCSGPGIEIYRESFTCDRDTYRFPNIGPLQPEMPVCIDGPAFVGIEYTDNPFGRFPSILWGDEIDCPPDDCIHWGGYGDNWWQWGDYWGADKGPPSFWVDGETSSPGCEPPQEVPALSEWGMIIMGLLFLCLTTIAAIRKGESAVSRLHRYL
jgi:hypothetical protein